MSVSLPRKPRLLVPLKQTGDALTEEEFNDTAERVKDVVDKRSKHAKDGLHGGEEGVDDAREDLDNGADEVREGFDD